MTTPKRALFLWGGMEFHDPRQTSELFGGLLGDRGYDVQLEQDLDILLDRDRLAATDLIVMAITGGKITDEQEAGLLEAVRSGTGLGGWHGGLADAFRDRITYQYAVGGQWVAHPGDLREYTVKITAPDDPIMEGVNDFGMQRSEQYYMHVDPANEVLATTTFDGAYDDWVEGVVMPVAWKKRYGAGKVFYCSIGHTVADFETPEARTITERGLVWATR